MSGFPSFDEFAAAAQSPFAAVAPGGGSVELLLTEVSDRRVAADTESFSIVFAGPADTPLPQGLVELSHEALGSFELFIVPISSDTKSTCYEAVFNSLVNQPA